MDFPTFEKNQPRPSAGAITVAPPAFDADAGHAKTQEALIVEQQWRDVAAGTNDVTKVSPLSLNRDSDYVTADPYTAP